jgi:type II secretory pathway component PulF
MTEPPDKPGGGDWMAGLDLAEPDAARSPWEPLRRWRWAIVGLGTVGLFEWLWLRFGWRVALAALPVAAIGATAVRLIRDGGEGRTRTLKLFAGLALGLLGGFWAGPGVGIGVALAAWFALSVRVWRLKIRHLMILLVLLAVGIRATQILGDALLALGLLLMPPLAVGLIYLTLRRRPQIEREGLIDVLAIAARSGLPMGPAVSALRALGPSGGGRRLQGLARRLEAGEPLPRVLREMPGLLPAESETLARLELPGTTTAAALEQAVAAGEARRRDPVSWSSVVAYPLTVLVVLLVALFYLHYSVRPRLWAIWTDFGLAGPAPGTIGGTLSRGLRRLGLTGLTGPVRLVEGGLLAGAVVGVVSLVGYLLRLQGVRMRLPWLTLRDERAVAGVLRGLSVGLKADLPVPQTLAALRRATPTAWIGRRLARAAEAVAAGVAWPEALRRRGLLSPAEAALVASSERTGHPAWALRELAAGRERRAADRLRVTATLLRTLALLALGAIVLAAAVAYFLPLVRLIEHFAEDW